MLDGKVKVARSVIPISPSASLEEFFLRERSLYGSALITRVEKREERGFTYFLSGLAATLDFLGSTFWYFPRATLLVLPCFAHLIAIWRR